MQESYQQFVNSLHQNDSKEDAKLTQQNSSTLTIADLCPNLMRSPSLYEAEQSSESDTDECSDEIELETDSTGSEDTSHELEICPELAFQALHVSFRPDSTDSNVPGSSDSSARMSRRASTGSVLIDSQRSSTTAFNSRSRRSSAIGPGRRVHHRVSMTPVTRSEERARTRRTSVGFTRNHSLPLQLSRRASTGSVSAVRSRRASNMSYSRKSLTHASGLTHASVTRSHRHSLRHSLRTKKHHTKVKVATGPRRYSCPQTWRYDSDFDDRKPGDVLTDDEDIKSVTSEGSDSSGDSEKVEPAKSRLENFDLAHNLSVIKFVSFLKTRLPEKKRLEWFQEIFDDPWYYVSRSIVFVLLSETLFFFDFVTDVYFTYMVTKQDVYFLVEAWLFFILACPWAVMWILCGYRIKQNFYREVVGWVPVMMFLLFPYSLVLPIFLKLTLVWRKLYSPILYLYYYVIPWDTSPDEVAFDGLLFTFHLITQSFPMFFTQILIFLLSSQRQQLQLTFFISIAACIFNFLFRFFTLTFDQISKDINALISYNLREPLTSMSGLEKFKDVYLKTNQV